MLHEKTLETVKKEANKGTKSQEWARGQQERGIKARLRPVVFKVKSKARLLQG